VEATVKWPGGSVPLAALTVGLFKIPFGFEVMERDRDRIFTERSTFIRALFPGEYDLGARLAGGWRFVRYALAVQNGEPIGPKTPLSETQKHATASDVFGLRLDRPGQGVFADRLAILHRQGVANKAPTSRQPRTQVVLARKQRPDKGAALGENPVSGRAPSPQSRRDLEESHISAASGTDRWPFDSGFHIPSAEPAHRSRYWASISSTPARYCWSTNAPSAHDGSENRLSFRGAPVEELIWSCEV